MALTVETGTGSASSESFASVAQADTRLADLGFTNWATLSTTEKEQALRRATAFMEQTYRNRWKGTRLLRAQALSWPRYGVTFEGFPVDSTTVPTEVVNTCIDLAFKAAGADLLPDQTRAVKREKVGPIETEYVEFASQGTRYASADGALSPFLKAQFGLVRA